MARDSKFFRKAKAFEFFLEKHLGMPAHRDEWHDLPPKESSKAHWIYFLKTVTWALFFFISGGLFVGLGLLLPVADFGPRIFGRIADLMLSALIVIFLFWLTAKLQKWTW